MTFWAYVRAIGESSGYTDRKMDRVSTFSTAAMLESLRKMGRPTEVLGSANNPSALAQKLSEYFSYRAGVLNERVRVNLLAVKGEDDRRYDVGDARAEYEEVKRVVGAHERTEVRDRKDTVVAVTYKVGDAVVYVPMNKQRDEKRAESYLTGMVNLLIAYTLDGASCDYDPRRIPVFDKEGSLYAAFSRRMDGSFPSTVNPKAMWEIKEYYYTTTFGSKVSDAVYITSLDGYERLDLQRETGIRIEHLVIVDAYDTWWGKGKSYLCRLIDVLNMGHVDEILFGREVRERLPEIARGWTKSALSP